MTDTMNSIFPYDKWERDLETLKEQYKNADPFPSIVLDDFASSQALEEAIEVFPNQQSEEWVHYKHFNEKKLALTKRELIPDKLGNVIDEFNGPTFMVFLSKLTGIQGLLPDSSLAGGGLHQSRKGGFLNVHADFTAHPHQKKWARRVNIIIYLNKNWEESYGGHLELWDNEATRCVKKVLPVFNRCVIFTTGPDSFHGHPHPLTCPDGWSRKSIALYYFTEEEKPFIRSTEYRADPKSSLAKKLVVWTDKQALRFFDFIKRRLGLSDALIGRLLKFLSR